MKLTTFPTPAQVYLYAGGIWIDDAFRIEYRKVNEKVPLYGYDELEFSGVARGHTMLTGNLIINYRYPGYLWTIIREHLKQSVDIQANPYVQLAHALIGATPDQRIEIIEQARQLNMLGEVTSVLKNLTSGDAYGKVNSINDPVGSILRDENGQHIPFSVKIYFDKPDFALYYREIVDIHFTGMSQAISASASGGDSSASGKSLFEVYSFFARNFIDKPKPGASYRQIIEGENRYVPVSSTSI